VCKIYSFQTEVTQALQTASAVKQYPRPSVRHSTVTRMVRSIRKGEEKRQITDGLEGSVIPNDHTAPANQTLIVHAESISKGANRGL